MKSSLYTSIQDIQNGDREQALALLEKFSPPCSRNMHSSCNQRMHCRISMFLTSVRQKIYNSMS